MRFTPYDIGTYLVRSRTRVGVHLVSLLGDGFTAENADDPEGCSCEGFETSKPFNTCAHYREAIKRRQRGKLPMIVAMSGHK